MPTIILLDVSLSMSRSVHIPECTEEYHRRHLGIHGINTMLDYIAINTKLEFCSLIVFSSLWEQSVGFTRDFESIKSALNKLEDYDKSCLMTALNAISNLVIEEWGSAAPCQIIVVTDGSIGIGNGSLKNGIKELSKREIRPSSDWPPRLRQGDDLNFPLPFPCKLHFMCITNSNENGLQSAMNHYQKLIDINGNGGEIFIPEGGLNLKSVSKMFSKLCEKYYAPFYSTLKCGHLSTNVQVYPRPDPFERINDFEHIKRNISNNIDVIGFLDIADIASPPVISKHLLLSTPGVKDENSDKDSKDEEDEAKDDGRTPCFTVLLHGSLKVESMVSIVRISEDWYGMLYSWADGKKKSNLMLSLYEPGIQTVPWLGKFTNLSPLSDFSENPYDDDDNSTPFPVQSERRSYAQSSTVWIRATGLQADVQKILRHARKLPEKQLNFYKELNRVRRVAVSLGFTDLFGCLASMLERECTLLPGSAHPDAALQLTHAAQSIKGETAKEIGHNITPLRTNFSSDD